MQKRFLSFEYFKGTLTRSHLTSLFAAKTRFLLLTTTVLGAATVAPRQPAWAQDATPGYIELDPLIVEGTRLGSDNGIVALRNRSASKTDTPLIEIPQAVSVVSRKQMDAQGAETVSQALRYTPGVLSESNGYDIRYDWIYIRGFNTYGTMWLDGLVLPGDPNNYATPSVNPYALERIEVIKGPASVLYGRAIPGGLVNQVSKRPQATPHREVMFTASGFGGAQASFDFTGPVTTDGTLQYRLIGQARNMNTQIDMERDKQFMLAPSLTWAPTDATSLTLYGYLQRDRPNFNPRFYPAVGTLLPNQWGQISRDLFLGDPGAKNFSRDFYAAGYEFSHAFNETWTFRQNFRYGRSSQDMFLVLVNPAFAYQSDGHTLNRASAVSDDWLTTLNIDSQLQATFRTGAFQHTALVGFDYLRSKSSTNFGNTTQAQYVPPLDILNPIYGGSIIPIPAYQRSALQTQEQLGVYAQDQIRYGGWIGTFGLRYDFSEMDSVNRLVAASPTVTTKDQKLTGRVGLTYLFDNGIAPYASFATSFLPTLGTDRFGMPFKAQYAQQYEVGVKYEPPGSKGLITVSLYNLTLDNALTPDPDNTLFSVQGGQQRVRGVEVEGKYQLTSEVDVLAAYAYSDSEIVKSTRAVELGQEMLRLPKHQASLWAQYRPGSIPGLALNAGIRGLSSYQTDSTYLPQLRIPGRALVDLGAEYDFGALGNQFKGTSLRVNVTNLFDKTYLSHCLNATGGSCNYGAGRAITAALKYTW
ncbi:MULTISPECIES: TonB-dependent siderophore receptor [unclassified Chelatococcus]|uniref:TonB-dependent siderophore receptor n=1 Tax=unclassified Chelatococcus TaxID=2638111 RepID=UPI0020BD9A25|nr:MULTISPECIES: TonB-dependent siderophore receptor [unclassified Chelatococcus]